MAETSIDRLTSGIPFENMGRLQFKIVILCFLAILFDGIDTTAIGVVVPTLAKSWAVPPASFTAAFLATNLGAVVGYIACGPISERIGRRPLIIVSVIWFGVCTLLTVLVDFRHGTVVAALRDCARPRWRGTNRDSAGCRLCAG